MIIPLRFVHHVLRHFVAASVRDAHPLLLAIQGEPGSGKSFQLHSTLRQAHIIPIHKAAADLAGGYEGDSSASLGQVVENARLAKGNTAIIVNDLDLSPAGQHANATYTVNSQLLVGALMDLCDQPDMLRRTDGYRVPIYITGNNLTLLPKPLTRASRMDIFEWEPTPEEKADIVEAMFRDSGIRVTREALITHASGTSLTIAAYAALLSDIMATRLYAEALKGGQLDLGQARDLLTRTGEWREMSTSDINKAMAGFQTPRDYINGSK